MNLRTLSYLGITTLILATLLVFIGLIPTWQHPRKQAVLSYNDVQGMAIESQGQLYTLNFEQQNLVVGSLNLKEGIPPLTTCAPTIDRLIVYRFNQPDWVINPRK